MSMKLNLLESYFSKLLNKPIDENSVIKLSSGQRVRANAWLNDNNFKVAKSILDSSFSIAGLIETFETPRLENESKKMSKLVHEKGGQNIYSVGIDIQSISELFPDGIPQDPKSDSELLAMFTLKELSYAQSRTDPMQTLAGIFAAKEAVLKCSTQTEFQFSSCEILPDVHGKPKLEGYSISISHSKEYAVGIAMVNREINFDENREEINKNANLENFIIELKKTKKQNKIFNAMILILIIVFLVSRFWN